ncbi:MAG: glycosyltransferase family 2 protein [bacterium]
MNCGIVIPAYNVASQVETVLDCAFQYINKDKIFLIDDGSEDNVSEIGQRKGVQFYRHKKNRGKGKALQTGFDLALSRGVDSVFTIDGDGQHNPDYIPEFIQCMETTQCDMVVGWRDFCLGKMPLDRIASNILSSLAVSLVINTKIPDSQCGYRLIRADLLKKMNLTSSKYEIETELILETVTRGKKLSFLPIESLYCAHHSNIRRFRDSLRFCNLLINSLNY